jgi:COP9 signalosome complex subunit 4
MTDNAGSAQQVATPSIISALAKLEGTSTTSHDKLAAYKKILDQLKSRLEHPETAAELSAFIDSVLGETLGIVAARPLLDSSILAIRSIPSTQARVTVGTHALSVLEPRVGSFEEQDASIREILAEAYQAQEEYLEAAKMLQGIKLESSQRLVSDETKIRTWMRICRLYLEEEDTTNAVRFLNKAKNLPYKVEDTELNLSFQLSQARILDSQRRFLDASQCYHYFSISTALDEEERMRGLSSAIICAVLAPAGPQRSRTLAKLYKDERAAQVAEFGILEKMFLDRLISAAEVATFAGKLAPHHLAQTADGSTVLAKAVIEHNLLSASRLYDNIGVSELGVLLGLEPDKAEQYAARMLEQKRLGGTIDQIDGVIFFEGQEGGQSGAAHPTATSFDGLRKWDMRVQGLAEEVERITSLLQANLPVM